ncbi:serine/threonine protein kinase [Actinomyces viscosus]|uniref:non-specific serine/threonine protein kinase n=1 Tax=Actinomyces viscosus TaxID=1656 RepID=A0A3S4VFL2_ACTVI|nr:serine/threonine protein kinase [Actinomyces viscosus]TFH53282.1 serine/threonine protein kinase [Actinomyces viscosus]VEI18124.1 Probable serine/threonine-protein kinase pknH [Actinomyces viscosus]
MTQNFDAQPGEPVTLSKLRAGTLVGGYRLLRRLGAGGMGVVWEAADEGGRHVAMKILHPQIAADPTARRRLDREASVLARVRDTRVARILDIETGDGSLGITFVITELVEGPTLQHEVEHEGVYDLTTDARDLADLAHGLVDSLRAVHSAGVIHRDLKPSNVMLGAQGPVLIDFGIAQVADDVRLTQTGQVTGTPGFIPPEMLDGGEPTAEVDWYACAGVLLFTVTGLAPFGSGAWQVVFRRVYAGTPELGDLEQENPALARAFTAALAPEAEDRLSPDGLLEVLDEIAEGGTGQEAVDRLLGPEEPEDDSEESETSTSTFVPGYGTTPGYGVAPGYGVQQSAGSASSASPAVYGSPVSAGSAAEGGYGYGAPSASSASSVQPPPAIPPRSWYRNSGSMPMGQAQSMQYGVGSPAPVTPSGAYPRPAPSGQVPMFPYSGYQHTRPQAAYPQPFAGPPMNPAAGAMVQRGPMAPTPHPAGAIRHDDLPDWAQEPERRPLVVLALGFALSAVGVPRPGWTAILAALVIVIAGVVGRAQDARRWNRLQRGSASPADTSRMWAMTPWYLVRSLLSVGCAFALGLGAALLILYIALSTGIMGSDPTVLTSLPVTVRYTLIIFTTVASYLLVQWLAPWGTATRRGGAHIINMMIPSSHRRRTVTLVLIAIGLIALLLAFVGAVPSPSFRPFTSI